MFNKYIKGNITTNLKTLLVYKNTFYEYANNNVSLGIHDI